MNEDIMQGKWKEVKGAIRRVWGDITGNELEETKGNMTEIAGLIQQKYGHKKEDVTHRLNTIMSHVGSDLRESTEDLKSDLRKSNEEEKTFKH